MLVLYKFYILWPTTKYTQIWFIEKKNKCASQKKKKILLCYSFTNHDTSYTSDYIR